MRKAGGTSIDRSKSLLEGRIGVSNARYDALGGKRRDVLDRTVVLGSKRALDDTAARRLFRRARTGMRDLYAKVALDVDPQL